MESLEMAEEETLEIANQSVRRQGSAIQQPSGVVAGIVTADLTPDQKSQLYGALVKLKRVLSELANQYE